MERIIIWGTGDYCKSKLPYMKDCNIVGYGDREKKLFNGFETLTMKEIVKCDFDKIVVMSGSFMEIIKDLIEIGIPYEKIDVGITTKPISYEDLEIVDNNTRLIITNEGWIDYYRGKEYLFTAKTKDDFKKAKKYCLCEDNKELINKLSYKPVGKHWGADRGGSIVRYYIDKFFDNHKEYIKGHTLEIGDDEYTTKYGANTIPHILCYDIEANPEKNEFRGNLETGEGIHENYFDTIILTQVLDFIFDIKSAVEVIKKSLKVGGKILVTSCGLSPVGRHEMERYGHYWNFTTASMKKLFESEGFTCDVESFGNSLSATAFLQGMSYREIDKLSLDYHDEDFQVVVAALVERKK